MELHKKIKNRFPVPKNYTGKELQRLIKKLETEQENKEIEEMVFSYLWEGVIGHEKISFIKKGVWMVDFDFLFETLGQLFDCFIYKNINFDPTYEKEAMEIVIVGEKRIAQVVRAIIVFSINATYLDYHSKIKKYKNSKYRSRRRKNLNSSKAYNRRNAQSEAKDYVRKKLTEIISLNLYHIEQRKEWLKNQDGYEDYKNQIRPSLKRSAEILLVEKFRPRFNKFAKKGKFDIKHAKGKKPGNILNLWIKL